MMFSDESDIEFSWDDAKEKANIKKHGLDFKIAANVFCNRNHYSILDDRKLTNEERWITFGCPMGTDFVLYIAHTSFEENGIEKIRIISARFATKKEREIYVNHRANCKP